MEQRDTDTNHCSIRSYFKGCDTLYKKIVRITIMLIGYSVITIVTLLLIQVKTENHETNQQHTPTSKQLQSTTTLRI